MTYETLPDEELAKRAQSNDSAAVNELLHRHKSLVNKAVRRFFLPSGDTDDLVQEGMVALFNAIMNYDEKAGASFTTFAYICVRKRIIGLIRKSSSGKIARLTTACLLTTSKSRRAIPKPFISKRSGKPF